MVESKQQIRNIETEEITDLERYNKVKEINEKKAKARKRKYENKSTNNINN